MPDPQSGPKIETLALGLWFLPWTQSQTTEPGTWALEQNVGPKLTHSPKAETQTVDVIHRCQSLTWAVRLWTLVSRLQSLEKELDLFPRRGP